MYNVCEMQMKDETKPCPHCGKQPKVWQNEYDGPGGPITTDWEIYCCSTMSDYSLENLIKRWNKRT